MKKLALILALTTAMPAYAGGPVIIKDPDQLVASGRDDKTPAILPILIGIGILAIIAGSGGGGGAACNGDEGPVDPGPVC